jgi:protein-tyrosine phosphatase
LPSILIICTANKFRSPIAAALLQQEIDLLPDSADWHIQSAGTWTVDALPPPPITIQVGHRLGLKGIGLHRTRQVDQTQMDASDLIIVMEANHKEALTSEFPAIKCKVFLLAEIVDGKVFDIPDPASPLIDANEVAKELYQLISQGYDKIIAKAKLLARNQQSG